MAAGSAVKPCAPAHRRAAADRVFRRGFQAAAATMRIGTAFSRPPPVTRSLSISMMICPLPNASI
jgi:hypothetical protein